MTERTACAAEIEMEEDLDHTEARVSLMLKGTRFTGVGRARRNPTDPSVPVVGEELATARALSDLAHHLVESAADTLGEAQGRPAQLHI